MCARARGRGVCVCVFCFVQGQGFVGLQGLRDIFLTVMAATGGALVAFAEADSADREMIEALQGKVDQMKEQAKQLEAMEAKVKSMMTRMRNKSPAEKRLEERYDIKPMSKTLSESYEELKKAHEELTPEERKARAENIKAKAAAKKVVVA